MVEFCPQCGSILIPEKKEGVVYLVCKACGFRKEARGAEYRQKETMDKRKRTKLTVISKAEEGEKLSEEKREMLKEYYEVFLSTMESAGEE